MKKKKKESINEILRKKAMHDAYDPVLARFYKTDRRETKGYKRSKSKQDSRRNDGY